MRVRSLGANRAVNLYKFRSGAASLFSGDRIIFFLITLIVTYLILCPVVVLIISSLKAAGDRLPLEDAPWTIRNYVNVFSAGETYVLFRNSIVYSLSSVSGALVIAAALVWLTERTDIPGRNLVFTLLLLPLGIPAMVKAIGWSFLASPTIGWINVLLRNILNSETRAGPLNIYSLAGIIFVSTLSLVPSIMLLIAGAFRNFDPSFEEASDACGASKARSQFRITIPLLRPALVAAFIYFFATVLDDFQIPAILGLSAGIRVFSTKIFLATHPNNGLPDFGLASGYGMVLFSVALVLIVIYRKVVSKQHRYSVVTGKAYRPRLIHLGKWKYIALAGVAIYLLLSVALPLFILLWVSLQPYITVPSVSGLESMTTKNYAALVGLDQFRKAAMNSGFVALVVPTVTMLVSTLTSWMAVRGQHWSGSIADFLTFLNTAVPSIVFAVAIMFVYLSFPIVPIYGSIWIIIIAFVTRYMSYSNRLMGAAVIQIHRELEEASEVSGASQRTTFFRVTLPLLLPSFLNGWLWVAVHALKEGTIAVMLMTPANVVVAALIWETFHEGGNHGLVGAMSIIITLVSFFLTLLARKALIPEWV